MRRQSGPVLVEPYAGSAAVSLAAFGEKPLTKWPGGKRGYAAEILHWLGVTQPPSELHLADIGGWFYVWRAIEVYGWGSLAPAVERLTVDAPDDVVKPIFRVREREVKAWGAIEPDAPDMVERAALWLWLVVRSFRAGVGKGFHCGQSPTLPLRAMAWTAKPGLPRVHAYPGAELIPPTRGRVVYIDPPYPGTTGYRGTAGHAVEDFRAIALAHQRAGSAVAVSLDRPVGIHARPLTFSGARGRAWSKQQAEWLTLYPQVRP